MSIVYFVQGEETRRVKIGSTQKENLQRRLSALQTGCSERIKLVGYFTSNGQVSENLMHRYFNRERIHGEWFLPSYRLDCFIDRVRVANKYGWKI